MTSLHDSSQILTDETERKPNLYVSNVLIGIVALIAIVCVMNELGVFVVNKILVRGCLLFTVLQFLLLRFIVRHQRWLVHPASKYIIMSIVLLYTLTITVLLNLYAVLAFVLPLLLATQYRSYRISAMALIGSCLCCLAAPVLAYRLDAFSMDYLTGYIETVCRVTVRTAPGSPYTDAECVRRILMYLSLPQFLTIGTFGLILFSVTRSGIDSVRNQVRVADLSNDLGERLDSILSMQEKVLYSMTDIIESRDVETGGHVRRTSEVVRMLTDAMLADAAAGRAADPRITKTFCSNVVKAAPMHDLGKIAVSDTILRKPGKLTPEEYDAVKLHPGKSAEMIDTILTGLEDEELLRVARNLAKYHHERVDGTGYPEHLRGKEIPLEARIMAIADVYDALVSERCYKAPMSFEDAFSTMESLMGTQFDPDLNPCFLACRERIEAYYKGNGGNAGDAF